MTGAAWKPWGTTRKRLAKLLEAQGYTVIVLGATQGRDRSDYKKDTYRWEAHVRKTHELCLGSYDTMTVCVRRGIEIDVPHGEVNAL